MNHSRERNAILNCDWSIRYCLVEIHSYIFVST